MPTGNLAPPSSATNRICRLIRTVRGGGDCISAACCRRSSRVGAATRSTACWPTSISVRPRVRPRVSTFTKRCTSCFWKISRVRSPSGARDTGFLRPVIIWSTIGRAPTPPRAMCISSRKWTGPARICSSASVSRDTTTGTRRTSTRPSPEPNRTHFITSSRCNRWPTNSTRSASWTSAGAREDTTPRRSIGCASDASSPCTGSISSCRITRQPPSAAREKKITRNSSASRVRGSRTWARSTRNSAGSPGSWRAARHGSASSFSIFSPPRIAPPTSPTAWPGKLISMPSPIRWRCWRIPKSPCAGCGRRRELSRKLCPTRRLISTSATNTCWPTPARWTAPA